MPVLRVRAHMQTPVALRDPLHLDAIMVARADGIAGRHITRSCPAAEIVRPKIPVCAVTFGGHTVALCSSEILPTEGVRRSEHLTRRRDGGDLDYLAAPIETRSGPGRDMMVRFPTVETPYLEWWCIGTRRGVRKLLSSRVAAVGMLLRHGYGRVHEWVVDTMPDDPVSVALVAGGVARRNLPASWCDSDEIVEQVPISPPYWHPSSVAPGLRAGRRTGLAADLLRELDRVR